MLVLGGCLRLVAVGDVLGQVLGEVADAPVRVPGPAQHALGVEPFAEPGDVLRFVLRSDRVERLVPGGQDFPGRRVEVVAAGLVPHRQLAVVVADGGRVRPPHLVVGGGEHLAQLGPGHGAAHRDVDVRGQPPLGFHGREVLHVVAEEPAKVLDEPVEQRREVQRIPGRPAVVVAVRVGRRAVAAHAPVARAGQRDEHRRAERRAVRGRVRLADRPGRYLAPGQVRRVLPPPGGPVTAGRAGRQHLPAHARTGDLLVQLAVQRVQLGRVLVLVPGPVALGLSLGPLLDQPALPVVRVVRVNDRLMIEMPAFPALGRPEHPGPFGARRADRGQRVPARHEDLFHPSRADIGTAELHRPQAGPVLGRDLPDHGPRERHRHPLGACPRPGLILCPRPGSPITSVSLGGPVRAVTAHAALPAQDPRAVIEQEQARAAGRAGLIGPPRRLFRHRASPASRGAGTGVA